jgi:DUF1680 family protein
MHANPSGKLPMSHAEITGPFWAGYQKLVRETVLPHQWLALNDALLDAEPSHAVANMRVAAGLEEGEYGGLIFQDSDLAKWLEAAAYSLASHPDAALEADVDGLVDILGKAQREDGYLNSYYIAREPGNRWTNLHDCHELYCAGHLIEAAVAYFHATGKRKFLDIMRRYADHIAGVFGPDEGQLKGYPGHEEIELALVKLYRATGERKYLELARYFIDERGRKPYYFDIEWEKRGRTAFWSGGYAPPPSENAEYNQSHLPVRAQADAVGHAVRAVYLYTAMADMAKETGDGELLAACRALWRSIVSRRMYVTGGIGSAAEGEAFTADFDLPNDTAYAETCAAIGLMFFAHRMLGIEPMGEYANVMERALYNNVLAGMSQDGKAFFYVNPLEVPKDGAPRAMERRHVHARRRPWFGCACCPPNIARLIASIGEYVYSANNDAVFVHLYAGGSMRAEIGCGAVRLMQETDYPLDGKVTIRMEEAPGCEITLALRIPGWCRGASLSVNAEPVDLKSAVRDGYAYLRRKWRAGDSVKLDLQMEPVRMRANPAVRADAGKVALQCGPFVYCLEECDNGSGLDGLALPASAELKVAFEPDFFSGANVITADGLRENRAAWGDALYQQDGNAEYVPAKLKFIPYYLWSNREQGEMLVWVKEIPPGRAPYPPYVKV